MKPTKRQIQIAEHFVKKVLNEESIYGQQGPMYIGKKYALSGSSALDNLKQAMKIFQAIYDEVPESKSMLNKIIPQLDRIIINSEKLNLKLKKTK